MKRIAYLLLFLAYPIFSGDFEKSEWRVEFGTINSLNSSLDAHYLSYNITDYFKNNYITDLNHYCDPTELRTLFNYLVLLKEYDLILEKKKIIKKINESTFNLDRSNLTKLEKELDEIDRYILNNRTLEFSRGIIPDNFPIKVMDIDKKKPQKEYEIKNYLKQQDLDYYITGEIEEDGNSIFIDIYLYSRFSNERVKIYSAIGSFEEIVNSKSQIMDVINRRLVNRELVNYSINVNDIDALIYINGVFKSIGSYGGYAFPNEEINIEIVKDGFKTIRDKKVINSFSNSFIFNMEGDDLFIVSLDSLPTGAKVYLESKYIGTTPLDIPLYLDLNKVELKKDGYMGQKITLDRKKESVLVNLSSTIIDTKENYNKKMNDFYISIGIFSMSLAPPLFFNSQMDTVKDDSDLELYRNISIGNAIIWGANVFYQLYEYLEAAKLSLE